MVYSQDSWPEVLEKFPKISFWEANRVVAVLQILKNFNKWLMIKFSI